MSLSEIAQTEWISALVTLLAGVVIMLLLRRAILMAAGPLRLQEDVARILIRLVISIVLVLSVVGALAELGVEIGPLLGALGISSVLLAMSLQPVLGNLVGSVMIDARRPIRRGDQIHSNGQSGTVIDINGRAVVLKTFEGEVVYLPNLKVLDEPLINQTRDEYRRTNMPFQVSYDTDLRTAQKALVMALRGLPALELAPPADVIVTGFGESGIDLMARFWHPSEELSARWVISEVAITIRETLAANEITIPYPQLVIHDGQDGAGPLGPTGTVGQTAELTSATDSSNNGSSSNGHSTNGSSSNGHSGLAIDTGRTGDAGVNPGS